MPPEHPSVKIRRRRESATRSAQARATEPIELSDRNCRIDRAEALILAGEDPLDTLNALCADAFSPAAVEHQVSWLRIAVENLANEEMISAVRQAEMSTWVEVLITALDVDYDGSNTVEFNRERLTRLAVLGVVWPDTVWQMLGDTD